MSSGNKYSLPGAFAAAAVSAGLIIAVAAMAWESGIPEGRRFLAKAILVGTVAAGAGTSWLAAMGYRKESKNVLPVIASVFGLLCVMAAIVFLKSMPG
jgi:drug/metabolite transporter (DMT)-like permease